MAYGQRASINVSITRIVSIAIRNLSHECPPENASSAEDVKGVQGGQHDWSEHIQGNILHAFYVGYFIGHIPAGFTTDAFSGKWTYFTGIGVSSTVTLVTPLIINHLEWYWVYVSRVVAGTFQAVVFPAMSGLVAHWIPSNERATFGAFSFSSLALGTLCGNFLSGILINYTLYWPSTFYFWAAMGYLWCSIVLIWIYDTPQKHPHITDREKAYLTRVMPHYVKLKVPWKLLLRDRGVWALIIGQIGHDFTLYLMTTNMPKYFSDVLRMNMRSIAWISSVPFLLLWFCSVISGRIVDRGIKERYWNVKWTRVIATYISFVLPNSLLCLMVLMECQIMPAAICFTLAVFFKGPHFAGFKVNHMDITVNFNGVVMAIVNCAGCIGGFISPLIVSHLAPNNKLSEWRVVMGLLFGLAFFFTTYYLFMATGKRALWDVPANEVDEFKHHEEEDATMRAEWKQHRVEEKQHRAEEKQHRAEEKQHRIEDKQHKKEERKAMTASGRKDN